jgi:hypothetical protein
VIQEIVLVVDVSKYGGILRVEAAAEARIILWFSQEQVGIVGAGHQPPAGGDGLLLHK